MSQVCQVTGKRPQGGMNVSHSHVRTHKRSIPNLHDKRFFELDVGTFGNRPDFEGATGWATATAGTRTAGDERGHVDGVEADEAGARAGAHAERCGWNAELAPFGRCVASQSERPKFLPSSTNESIAWRAVIGGSKSPYRNREGRNVTPGPSTPRGRAWPSSRTPKAPPSPSSSSPSQAETFA